MRTDVIVFGGGVAGLCLLARLRAAGYGALLVEARALGAGQTAYSQGILHGGVKYALTGHLSASSEAVADMPAWWRAALAGGGPVDLRAVQVLSPYQYLWSTAQLGSRLTGFFASKLVRGRLQTVRGADLPAVFQSPGFKGRVYRLAEPVLDSASLVRALAEPWSQRLVQASDVVQGATPDTGDCPPLRLPLAGGGQAEVQARHWVLMAGAGNADLLTRLGMTSPAMQLRPLHMVLVRGALPGALYGHCMSASVNPRLTVTSHADRQGRPVWYLGGQLAEDGVARTRTEQIAHAQEELAAVLPWLTAARPGIDWGALEWTTLRIDRAEPQQPKGARPASFFLQRRGAVTVAWPTKLVLAPKLAEAVLEDLRDSGLQAQDDDVETVSWRAPDYAVLPWQDETLWN